MQNFINLFAVIDMQFILGQISSADCISSFSYYPRFLTIVLAPLVLGAVLLIFYVIPRYLELSCCAQTPSERRRTALRNWKLFLYSVRLFLCRGI